MVLLVRSLALSLLTGSTLEGQTLLTAVCSNDSMIAAYTILCIIVLYGC
jgi:hypothetical protein